MSTPIETEQADGRIVSQLVDNGDGSWTFTTYDAAGNPTGSETTQGHPVPAPELPTVDAQALLDVVTAKANEQRAVVAGLNQQTSTTRRIADANAAGLDALVEIVSTLIPPT